MIWVIIGILCLAVDRLSKIFVSNNFMLGQSSPVINRVFHITYHLNDGAAFSILRGKTVLLTIFTVIIIIGILVFIIKKKPKNNVLLMSLTLILSGAVGNLIDRIGSGQVTDFLDFRLINFPVFNFADCFVVVGGILLVIYLIKFTDSDGKEKDGTKKL